MNAMDELLAEHEAVSLALKILSQMGRHMDEKGEYVLFPMAAGHLPEEKLTGM